MLALIAVFGDFPVMVTDIQTDRPSYRDARTHQKRHTDIKTDKI